MKTLETFSSEQLDTESWINKYIGLNFKHQGETIESGLDCFNLTRLVYKEVLGVIIPYSTNDHDGPKDEHWYNSAKYSQHLINHFTPEFGWLPVDKNKIKPFDVCLMSIGATNGANHCALYLPSKEVLHIMMGYKSWKVPYGRHYKDFTVRVGRWDLDYGL